MLEVGVHARSDTRVMRRRDVVAAVPGVGVGLVDVVRQLLLEEVARAPLKRTRLADAAK